MTELPEKTIIGFLRGIKRNTRLSFQKIVLSAFGEWIEGEDRLTGRQIKSLSVVHVQERIDSVQYLSIDNGGMMSNL